MKSSYGFRLLDPLALNDNQEIQPGTSGRKTPSTHNPQKTTEGSTPQQTTQAASNQNKTASVTPANQNKTTKAVSTGLQVLGARSKRGRKKPVEIPLVITDLQKTSLYSINPFCIPIRYLNPKVKPVTPAKEPISTSTAAAPTPSDDQV